MKGRPFTGNTAGENPGSFLCGVCPVWSDENRWGKPEDDLQEEVPAGSGLEGSEDKADIRGCRLRD